MIWIAGPLQWRTQPMPAWNPPPGFSLLDLRSLPDHAEGTSGRAVFFGDGPHPGSDYTLIGSGSWADIKPTGKARGALPRRAGFTPTGETLRDQLLSILTDGADPAGLDGARPILPTVGRRVELHCGVQQFSRSFALDGSTHANRVRDVLRADFAAVFDAAQKGQTRDPEIHRRVLDFWCQQYGVADWREFVPAALRPHVPGRLPHATTITDDFNRSDGSLGTAAGGWSWNAVSGTWGITSNNAGKSATGSVTQLARAESDLSSADQRCQIRRVSGASGWFQGPACRVSSSAATCYMIAEFSGYLYIAKLVAGAHTNLVATACPAVANDVYKLAVNGSTLTSHNNGTALQSTTDTSITGNLRCGMVLYAAGAQAIDDFEAADLLTHYTLTAAQGAFALSGQAAGLKTARLVAAGQGSFVLSGQAATLKAVRTLAAGHGSFALSGQAAGLRCGRAASAGQGSFALSGQAAGLRCGRAASAGQGSFALAGQSAGLLAARTLSAGQGSFALSGQSAALQLARGVAAAVGSFALVGRSAALQAVRRLTASRGSFALAGQAAILSTTAAGEADLYWLARRVGTAWRATLIETVWTARRVGLFWRAEAMTELVSNVLPAHPSDAGWRYGMDLSNLPQIVGGATIASVSSVTATPTGLTISGAQVDSPPTSASAVIAGGAAGIDYEVTFVVTLSTGETVGRTGIRRVQR